VAVLALITVRSVVSAALISKDQPPTCCEEHTMNTNRLISALAFATIGLGAASAALAQEATPDTWMAVQGTQSRAAVQAELFKARADGSIAFSRAGFIEPLKASTTREAVRDQALVARRTGELASINAEVYTHETPVATRVAGLAR
jgi:hypothetical protein